LGARQVGQPPGWSLCPRSVIFFVYLRRRLLLGSTPVADWVLTEGLAVAPRRRRRRPLSELPAAITRVRWELEECACMRPVGHWTGGST
ncbi:unnamed protein product, partial [Ixodes persulcatus]